MCCLSGGFYSAFSWSCMAYASVWCLSGGIKIILCVDALVAGIISGSYSYKSMHLTHNCIESIVYMWLMIDLKLTLLWSILLECIFFFSFWLRSFDTIYFMTLFLCFEYEPIWIRKLTLTLIKCCRCKRKIYEVDVLLKCVRGQNGFYYDVNFILKYFWSVLFFSVEK